MQVIFKSRFYKEAWSVMRQRSAYYKIDTVDPEKRLQPLSYKDGYTTNNRNMSTHACAPKPTTSSADADACSWGPLRLCIESTGGSAWGSCASRAWRSCAFCSSTMTSSPCCSSSPSSSWCSRSPRRPRRAAASSSVSEARHGHNLFRKPQLYLYATYDSAALFSWIVR